MKLVVLVALFALCAVANAAQIGNFTGAARITTMAEVMKMKEEFWSHCEENGLCNYQYTKSGPAACVDGDANGYPCKNMELLSFIPKKELALNLENGNGNDMWGWKDTQENKLIAISCVYSGVSFVDMTDPKDPYVLGFMRTYTVGSSWRDVKVYKDHAYVISEAYGHGMQVFDLTRLREQYGNRESPVTYSEDAHYNGVGSSHNIVINEDTGFAYIVGSKYCRGGLFMVDIRDPKKPVYAGCYGDDAYTHDAQCVVYHGPDTRYTDREICFAYNEDTLTIVDVTDKKKPELLARRSYSGFAYTHQGWLSDDHSFAIMNDELDETRGTYGGHTRTMVWNVENLQVPYLDNSYFSALTVIDHNLYMVPGSNLVYLSNYCGGLRVYLLDEDTKQLCEVAFFDIAPGCSTVLFEGAWSSYPYFGNDIVAVNGIESGLFIVKLDSSNLKCPE